VQSVAVIQLEEIKVHEGSVWFLFDVGSIGLASEMSMRFVSPGSERREKVKEEEKSKVHIRAADCP